MKVYIIWHIIISTSEICVGGESLNVAFWQRKSGSLHISSYIVRTYGCYKYQLVVTMTATRMPLKGSMTSPMRYDVITWKREGIHGSTANSPHKGPVMQALISSFMVTKQTLQLPVIWEAGVLLTSLWLKNRFWLVIHWILWPLIS